MEPVNQPGSSQGKTMLPNATTVLVLGICSIVFCCLFVGLVVGIIGLVLGNKAKKLYKEAPQNYDGWSQLNAGWIMSIIGTCLSGLYIIYYIILIAIIGSTAATFWNMNNM
jgi:hypothetical protein